MVAGTEAAVAQTYAALCAAALAVGGCARPVSCGSNEAQRVVPRIAEVTADVRAVKPRMLESVPRVLVTLEFANHSGRALVVDSVRLRWDGSQHVEKDVGVVLPANESASKTVEVVTADVPDPSVTRVEILATHEPSLWERLRK
jgi:hypothetical protein